jgi:hypothetical protein
MKKPIIQIIILVCVSFISNAQNFITLSPREQNSNQHKIVVSAGNRVKCKFINGSKIIGVVDKIMDDSIQINGKKFVIEDIRSIAKREKGSTTMIVVTQLVLPLGGAISIAVGNLPIAIGCFTVQIVGSLLFVTPLYDYPLRNVKKKWVMSVQDLSNQNVLDKKY